jgi:glutamate 5-kinase
MFYSLSMHKQSVPFAGVPSRQALTEPTGERQRGRVVIKLGSRLLTQGSTRLAPERLTAVARCIAEAPDQEVVIVSSGAVAAGFDALGLAAPPTRVRERQAAAAVGQGRLMKMWADAFSGVDRTVAQVLLTNDCLTDRRRYNAARGALGALLRAGIVPIVNENDTVSVEEIIVGDNDNLAAMTAALVDADLLALLTDVPGVLTGDPERDPDARLVERAASAAELRGLCFAKKAIESTGGMVTKLEAAERAGRFGIPTVVADGTDPSALSAVVHGRPAGTFIEADREPLPARRHWMAVQKGLTGHLVVDDGAVRAIRRRASLLPSGIVGVGGRFRRGDLVSVVDGSGTEHARGIVRFDDREVDRIRGLHTDEVRAALGVAHGHVVMRPDRMVLSSQGESL